MRKDGYVARPLHQRLIAGVLAALMGIFPIMTPVYAASYSVPTLLADTPINTKNQAKPNIILTVDDSTSMLYDFLPDYVVSTYCRDGTGMMNSPCGYAGSPGSAGPGGQYVSPQYVWEQPNSVYLKSVFGATAGVALPFPATGTGAGAVPPRVQSAALQRQRTGRRVQLPRERRPAAPAASTRDRCPGSGATRPPRVPPRRDCPMNTGSCGRHRRTTPR